MSPNYLYIARSQSDPDVKKYNVYKVGHSSRPLERIRTLGGSGSTETYEAILIVALPQHVKDLHILSHRCIQKFVVYRHETMRSKYTSIFGQGHANGIKRRREIVMFGQRFSVSKIKELFRRVVENISSQTGNYSCTDTDCASTGGATDCAVCVKFTNSLMNRISYQKGLRARSSLRKRKRILETVETQLVAMISAKKKQRKWKGPCVGAFWILRPDADMVQRGFRFRVVRVISNDKRRRVSTIQGWCGGTDGGGVGGFSLISILQSRFTNDGDVDILSWDQNEWQCIVQMKQFKSFCRIMNVSDVNYATQQWISTPIRVN